VYAICANDEIRPQPDELISRFNQPAHTNASRSNRIGGYGENLYRKSDESRKTAETCRRSVQAVSRTETMSEKTIVQTDYITL
jgi:hypothetical protein